MDCYCGNSEYVLVKNHPPAYVVTDEGKTVLSSDPYKIGCCTKCFVMRQLDAPITDYSKYPPTKSEYEGKSFEHDLSVAKARFEWYEDITNLFKLNKKSLDIGSGSGAMIEVMKSKFWDAYGCELSAYRNERNSDRVYRKDFTQIHFPTDHFQFVTAHDVIEHVYDPLRFAEELFRITDEKGCAVIEIPDFFLEGCAGEHHWKHEHLWYFSEKEMNKLLAGVGFLIDGCYKPIEGKITFLCRKPKQKRTKILFPPGIGDCYWSLVKLQDFIKQKGIKGQPEVSVVCPRPKKFEAHKRAFPFLEMFPFLKSTGEARESKEPEHNKIWKEAYLKKGRVVFEEVMDNDYFIALNGQMRYGVSVDELPYETNWYPDRFISLEESQFMEKFKKENPRYIVFYFVFHGVYERWVEDLGGVKNLVLFVKKLCSQLQAKPIFVGADWDAADKTLSEFVSCFPPESDCTGKTTVGQLFGLLRGSEMCVGFPSGLTIMSPVLGVKTFTLWNNYYHEKFFWNVVPPDVVSKGTYMALNTKYQTPEGLTWKAVDFYNSNPNRIGNLRTQEIPKVKPDKNKDFDFTVVCVLRSGGDYDEEYVIKLKNAVKRNATKRIDFVCISDVPINDPEIRNENLISDFPGWWSKVEMFRSELYRTEYALYIDLDTVILQNIDSIFSPTGIFASIVPWNTARRKNGEIASGIMLFKTSELRFIYEEFSMGLISDYKGDQDYILESLREHNIPKTTLPKMIHGIKSYKRDILRYGMDISSRIICFHGKPRPRDIQNFKWMKENWK